MHRGLGIPEIVGLIVTDSGAPSGPFPPAPDFRTLARLARTCTAFSDPALNILWEYQDTILNILGCFPSYLFEMVHDHRGPVEDIRMLRSVSPTDWERPLFYSSRVKMFRMHYPWPATTAAFETIRLSCPQPHLFPNLDLLDLTHRRYSEEDSTHYINFLLSPRITTLGLAFGGEVELLRQIVGPALTVQCPSLGEVAIRNDGSDELALPSVSTFVRNLVRIHTLTVENLDREAFEHLGNLPTLKVLTLRNLKVPAILRPVENTNSMYASLETLRFGTTRVEHVAAFLDLIRNSPVKKFKIEYLDEIPTKNEPKQLYSTLAAHFNPLSFRIIVIEHGGWVDGDVDEYPDSGPITGDVLSIMFCFINLVSVSLNHPFGFDLNDADIFNLACAWPRIEKLSLGYIIGWSRRPRVTLYGLYAFAQHCPNLGYLAMPCDATGLPEWEPASTEASQTRLKWIDVKESAIDDIGRVAAFLSSVFPCVTIRADRNDELEGEEAEYSGRWEKVGHIVKESLGKREGPVNADGR
ncbi:hypothetical protein C8R44DRAFT_784060 [Mycena epipterygia]|nr:hypothetical protein C8R44DRAFT_784060 [Mycena epipterygia]